jgi:hypothetical protein
MTWSNRAKAQTLGLKFILHDFYISILKFLRTQLLLMFFSMDNSYIRKLDEGAQSEPISIA